MGDNTQNRIDKFFKDFHVEIDAHFDKVFKLIDDLKRNAHQNKGRLSRQIINKADI